MWLKGCEVNYMPLGEEEETQNWKLNSSLIQLKLYEQVHLNIGIFLFNDYIFITICAPGFSVNIL